MCLTDLNVKLVFVILNELCFNWPLAHDFLNNLYRINHHSR